ncbi:hypothetical protein K3552_05475 [Leisingera aquaemixtae]|uniref:hypothetical protein n=1 Tax=Leisingera aquaemixtae TaxID=1396826 RepID=UPI0021A87BAE|nr:hypothetical protein [Leisingera aquaemixtae]UWQ38460.1 hypothetical protein K3552_05475 [Leisingera aquaemixtae]
MRTKNLQVSISIPDIASLGDDEMPAIAPHRDGRWSNQTKELLEKFGTHKLDLNRGWASTWTEWSCPCCKRHKRQIVRLTSGGVLLCHLELHHDHLGDLMKKLFEEILSHCDNPEIRVQISRAEGALRPLVERFECALICADCNLADGRVKRELRDEIEPHFTFTPSEIADFITVSDNRVHEVDFERARGIWTEQKEGLADRVDFARRMATRIKKGRHHREVAPGKKLQGQPQARDILFRLCEAALPDIHSLHLGASIEARSVARDGVGGTQKPAKRENVKPPTDAEFAMLDAEQSAKSKHWRNAGDIWKCPCCGRTKREICRRSKRGKWTARIHRFEGFDIEDDAEQLWRRRLDGAGDIVISEPKFELICQDCREIVAKQRQRRADLDARALTLENLRELSNPATVNVAHDVNFENVEEMITKNSPLLDAIAEFENHQRRATDAHIKQIRLTEAGCSATEARDLIGYEIAKARDWEIEDGDDHADWLLAEAARLGRS